jgi:DNA polymerase I
MELQIIDLNYYVGWGNEPVITIFGRSLDKSEMIKVTGFHPYFLALPYPEKDIDVIMMLIESSYANNNVRVELVNRYLPMGYQENKSQMYKINYINPKDTKTLRESIIRDSYAREVYEADILFKNRFMIDLGIHPFDWISVPSNRCDYRKIKVMKDDI